MDSYNDILQRMKDEYSTLTGNCVPELSDTDIRMKILAGEIYNDEVNLEYIKNQMFAKTATGSNLDLHALDRGLERKQATKATGSVVFSITLESDSNITIPAGTIVATSGATAYCFVTDEDAVLPIGDTSVEVNCTAQQGGKASNVAKGKIDVIVTTVNNVESVTNTSAFTGGTDEETDDELRERILDSYVYVSNGTNSAYYKRLAMSVDGVTGVNVAPKIRGVGTVDVYICSGKASASSDLIAQVQQLMDEQRELNVDVLVCNATPSKIDLSLYVTLKDGFDFDSVCDDIKEAVNSYMDSLSIGDSVLQTHLGNVVMSVDGVYTYRWNSTSTTDFNMAVDSFPVLNSLTIEEDSSDST